LLAEPSAALTESCSGYRSGSENRNGEQLQDEIRTAMGFTNSRIVGKPKKWPA
jgi:hypothetical protein